MFFSLVNCPFSKILIDISSGPALVVQLPRGQYGHGLAAVRGNPCFTGRSAVLNSIDKKLGDINRVFRSLLIYDVEFKYCFFYQSITKKRNFVKSDPHKAEHVYFL